MGDYFLDFILCSGHFSGNYLSKIFADESDRGRARVGNETPQTSPQHQSCLPGETKALISLLNGKYLCSMVQTATLLQKP